MRAFRYLRDPLSGTAVVAYALNRWAIKPWVESVFLRHHFNDTLVIPAALPGLLWLHRRFGWRSHDHPPTAGEIAGPVLVWSLICEVVGPHWLHRGTADWRDVIAYAAGGAVAWGWWRWFYRSGPIP